MLIFTLVSCTQNKNKSNLHQENGLIINVNKDEFKIMQLTDVHLTYGFDYLDRKTFKLINGLITKEEPDIIIVTGDLFMTLYAKSVFKKFIKFIDSYDIPWSITFGNHELEFHKMTTILNVLLNAKTKNLYFNNTDLLEVNDTNGYANFKLEIFNEQKHLMNLYLLDTKANRKDGINDKDNPYDNLSSAQVGWYSDLVMEDKVKSLVFMHTPLRQYLKYEGDERGEKTWPQALDTGFYDAMTNPELGNNKTLGVFVGHDHLNSFAFKLKEKEPLLAYGLTSGYNAYGNHDKGARFITYNFNSEIMDTYLVTDKELNK